MADSFREYPTAGMSPCQVLWGLAAQLQQWSLEKEVQLRRGTCQAMQEVQEVLPLQELSLAQASTVPFNQKARR